MGQASWLHGGCGAYNAGPTGVFWRRWRWESARISGGYWLRQKRLAWCTRRCGWQCLAFGAGIRGNRTYGKHLDTTRLKGRSDEQALSIHGNDDHPRATACTLRPVTEPGTFAPVVAEKRAGAVYLFESADARAAYLASDLAAMVASHPALSDFRIQEYAIMAAESMVTYASVHSLMFALS